MNDKDFNLETLKRLNEIDRRLSAFEITNTKIDFLCEKLEQHDVKDEMMFKKMQENIDKLNILIIGDGKNAGVAEKLRGVEHIIHNIKAIWVAVFGFVGEFLFRTFFHHKG